MKYNEYGIPVVTNEDLDKMHPANRDKDVETTEEDGEECAACKTFSEDVSFVEGTILGDVDLCTECYKFYA